MTVGDIRKWLHGRDKSEQIELSHRPYGTDPEACDVRLDLQEDLHIVVVIAADDYEFCGMCDSVDPNGVESTYCGSMCPDCLREHCKECKICANDFAKNF